MTYAIVEIAGKQYKVSQGDKIAVDKLPYEIGEAFDAKPLALIQDEPKEIIVDKSVLVDKSVKCKVVEHTKGEKIIVFKKKRRKGYKKKQGHRQQYTHISIEDIVT